MTRIEQIQQALARARAAGDNEAAAEIESLLAREQGEEALRVNAANPSSVNLTQEQIDERQREAVRQAEEARRVAPLPQAPTEETTTGSLVEAGGTGILDQLQQAGSFIGATVVDPVQNAIEWAEAGLVGREPRYRNRLEESRQISENLRQGLGEMSTAEQIAFGAGSAVGMIPETLAGGGLIRQGARAGTALLNEGAETAAEFALRQTREGAAATSLLAPRLGAQTSAEAEAAGATPFEATVAGAADTLGTMLTAGLPISARGNLAQRAATGAVGGIGAEAGASAAVTPFLPEELQAQRDILAPENATMAAVLGAGMGAAFGTRPSPRVSDAAAKRVAELEAVDPVIATGAQAAQELPAVAQAERAIAELMSNLPEGGLDLETRRGEASTLLDTAPVIEEPAGPSSPFLPRSERVNLEARRGEASSLLDVPTEAVAEPQGPVSILPGVSPQDALALDTPRGEATQLQSPEATLQRFEAQRVDAEEQTARLQAERQTLLQNPTREGRLRVKEIDREMGRQAIRRAVAVNALSNPATVQSAPVETPTPELPLTRQARVSTLEEARSLSQPITQPEATAPAPVPQTATTAPLTRAERVAQAAVPATTTTDVLDPATGRTAEQVAETAIAPNDPERVAIEQRILRDAQQAAATNRSIDPRLMEAASRVLNRTVAPEQRQSTPLRQALSRATTAWDALAGVRAAVSRGADPKIERYDRLIQVLSTPDMKDVEFSVLQPETEARTEAQRRVKEGRGLDAFTKGIHEIDRVTGKQSVTITGDGYASRDGTATVETTLHEIVHAKGTKAIREVLNGTERDERVVKAVKNYENIRKEVRKADRKDLTRDEAEAVDYATENLYEFHSGAMTNPLVQSAMKKEGFFKRWVNTIRVLIGVPRSQKSALDEVLDAAYAIVDAVNTVNAERSSPQNQTNTPAFKRWFDGSSIVNDDGSPRVVYHGTRADFSEFRPGDGSYGTGIYMTPSREFAGATYGAGERGLVMPLYASVKSPYVVEASSKERSILDGLSPKEMTDKLKRLGFDGVVVELNGEVQTVVAFDPEQVKSATGNQGSFDPTNPDIRRSASRQNNNPDATRARERILGKGTKTRPMRTTQVGMFVDRVSRRVDSWLSAHKGGTKETTEAQSKAQGVIQRTLAELQVAVARMDRQLHSIRIGPRAELARQYLNAKPDDKPAIAQKIGDEKLVAALDRSRSIIDNLSNRLRIELVSSYAGKDMPQSTLNLLKTIERNLGTYTTRAYLVDLEPGAARTLWGDYKRGDAQAKERLQPLMDMVTGKLQGLSDWIEGARQEAELLSSTRLQFDPEETQFGRELRQRYSDFIGNPGSKTKAEMFRDLEKFASDLKKEDFDKQRDNAVQKMLGVFEDNGTADALSAYYRGMRGDDRTLRQRENVPPELRKAWGEILDPILTVQLTANRAAAALAGIQSSNYMVDEFPNLFSSSVDGDTNRIKQIPNNGVAYGKAAGMYTTPEVFEFMTASAATLSLFDTSKDATGKILGAAKWTIGAARTVTSYAKLNMIAFNITTQTVLSTLNFVAMPLTNGHFNLKRLPEAIKLSKRLVGTSYRTSDISPELLEIIEQGVVDPVQLRVDEEARSQEKENRLLVSSLQGGNIAQQWLGALRGRKNQVVSHVIEPLRETVSFFEVAPKVFNFLAAKDELKAAYPEMNNAEVVRLAAEQTNRLNPTYARTRNIVGATETLGVSYTANYMEQIASTTARSLKMGYDQAKLGIQTGDTPLALMGLRKLMGVASVAGLSYALPGMIQAAFGLKESEEDELIKDNLPFVERGMQPVIIDSDGEFIRYFDAGRLNPYDTVHAPMRAILSAVANLTSGNTEEASRDLEGATKNLAGQFAGGSPLGQTIVSLATNTPRTNTLENDLPGLYSWLVTAAGGDKRAAGLASSAYVMGTPSIGRSFISTLSRYLKEEPGEDREAFVEDKVNSLTAIGVPVRTANANQNMTFQASSMARARTEASTNLGNILLVPGNLSDEDIEAAVDDYLTSQLEPFAQAKQVVEARRALGRRQGESQRVTDAAIRETLKAERVDGNTIESLLSDNPFTPKPLSESFSELRAQRRAQRDSQRSERARLEALYNERIEKAQRMVNERVRSWSSENN